MTIATRLHIVRPPKPSTGRHVRCSCCSGLIVTAKPQDPMRDEGTGVCESCRRMVATEMTQYGYAGKVYTMSEAITHLTRYA